MSFKLFFVNLLVFNQNLWVNFTIDLFKLIFFIAKLCLTIIDDFVCIYKLQTIEVHRYVRVYTCTNINHTHTHT